MVDTVIRCRVHGRQSDSSRRYAQDVVQGEDMQRLIIGAVYADLPSFHFRPA